MWLDHDTRVKDMLSQCETWGDGNMKNKNEIINNLIIVFQPFDINGDSKYKYIQDAIDYINIQADKIKNTNVTIKDEIDQVIAVHREYSADDVIRILHRIEKA